ncbi:hypothetical protein [Bdellovibrio sp. HCB288]|uniref:hypothetical protein n=1 Tax=Bdellovibrio sp. HCB288 TaxID=3394355 RepID=UPI0039B6681B
MKNSFCLLLCGLFLTLNAAAAESSFRRDLLAALQIYAKQNNLGLNKPSDNFMGFSVKSASAGNLVTVYHADSTIDIITNEFICNDSGCELKSREPRCFYYTPGGKYSALAIYDAAFEQLEAFENGAIDEFKFWQLGAEVFGRISDFQENHSELYSCHEHANQLVCASVSEIPGEP